MKTKNIFRMLLVAAVLLMGANNVKATETQLSGTFNQQIVTISSQQFQNITPGYILRIYVNQKQSVCVSTGSSEENPLWTVPNGGNWLQTWSSTYDTFWNNSKTCLQFTFKSYYNINKLKTNGLYVKCSDGGTITKITIDEGTPIVDSEGETTLWNDGARGSISFVSSYFTNISTTATTKLRIYAPKEQIYVGTTKNSALWYTTNDSWIRSNDDLNRYYNSNGYFDLEISSSILTALKADGLRIDNNSTSITKVMLISTGSSTSEGDEEEDNYIDVYTNDGSIGFYGYRTYVTETAVDFAHSIGVEAYYATGVNAAGTEVQFTQVIGVCPADVPLLLKATDNATEYKLLKTTASATAPSPNKLEAGPDEEVKGANKYVLTIHNGEVVFAEVNINGAEVDSEHAYLDLSSTNARGRLTIRLNKDITGISDIEADTEVITDGAIYNLRGQRVEHPTKGLYIINGKKVVIK